MLSGELCASLLDVLLFALKILFGISPIALFSLRCRAFVKRFFGNVNFVSGIWSESLLNYASIPLLFRSFPSILSWFIPVKVTLYYLFFAWLGCNMAVSGNKVATNA